MTSVPPESMSEGRQVECVFDPFDLSVLGGPLERAAVRPTTAGEPSPYCSSFREGLPFFSHSLANWLTMMRT